MIFLNMQMVYVEFIVWMNKKFTFYNSLIGNLLVVIVQVFMFDMYGNHFYR